MITCIIVTFILKNKQKQESKEPEVLLEELEKQNDKSDESVLLKVDIKGEINKPGIYSLTPESRVIDVIEEAGGLTGNANTTVINLSKKITDEMVIIVYSNDQVKDFQNTKKLEQEVQTKCIQPEENIVKNDACITSDVITSTKVSINTATQEQLQILPGIGESKAKDIISYREQNGPFTTIEDIKNVSGIGESVFAKIKDYITP